MPVYAVRAEGRATTLVTVTAESREEALRKAELVPMHVKFGHYDRYGDVDWERYEIEHEWEDPAEGGGA